MDLPSHEQLAERSERVRAHIEAFAAQRDGDLLLWCHLPRLLHRAPRAPNGPIKVPARLPRAEIRRMRAVQLSRRKRTEPRGFRVQLGGGCLFRATTPNLRHSQAPLHDRFGPLRSPDVAIRLPFWRMRRLVRQASELTSDLLAFCRSNELELPIDFVSLHQSFLRTARFLVGWELLLAKERPRVVVVGVQTPTVRALLHAVRQAGIPSVYVPHSPLRSEAHLMDFAVDYLALRGPAEADVLARHGVRRDRLDVVGNPSIVPESSPDIDPSLPVVFAPSEELSWVHVPLIALVRGALGGRVMVGRHPNANPEGASEFPQQWSIYAGRTYDLLKSGPPVVLQRSSGVALESMHLGIPVIELHFPGETPIYPLICEPHVRLASTSQQLRAAVAAGCSDAWDPTSRERLIAWARQWSWPAGAEAGERLVALVESAIANGPRDPISAQPGWRLIQRHAEDLRPYSEFRRPACWRSLRGGAGGL